MLTQDAFTLLKKTPPFSFLDDAVLKNMTKEMLMEFHPKGKTILCQNCPAADHVSIIKSGSVKVFVSTNEGEEVLVGYRTTGDFLKKVFLAHVAGQVVKNGPSLGFFGKFICETEGSHKGKFDVKVNGLSPIIDAARLAALEMKVYHTSTLARLLEVRDRSGSVASEYCQELEQASNFSCRSGSGINSGRWLKELNRIISSIPMNSL